MRWWPRGEREGESGVAGGGLAATTIKLDDGAAGLLDLLACGLREALGADGQLGAEVAVPEELEELGVLGRQALGQDRVEVDGGAVIKRVQETHVEDRVVRTEASVGEATLRYLTVDRHLATLVASTAAGTRALTATLVATAGGLAITATGTATHALAGLVLGAL